MSGRGRGRGSGRGYGYQGGERDTTQSSVPYRARGDSRGGFSEGQGPSRGGRGGSSFTPIVLFDPGYPAVEDTALTQRENKLLESSGPDKSIELPRRPAYGKQGAKVILWTNYVRMQIGKDLSLYRYEIKCKELGKRASQVPRGIIKRLVELLITDYLRPLRVDAASDYRATLITRRALDDDQLSFIVVYRAEGENEPLDDAPQYTMTLESPGTLSLAELIDYSTSSSVTEAFLKKQELIQALNIIVGHVTRTDPAVITVGRNIRASTTANQHRTLLSGGLEALRAFVFSVRTATERVLINVQVKNLPFWVPTPLATLVGSFVSAGGTVNSLRPFLRLLSVEVTHIRRRGKSGNTIPRYKTIFGTAKQGDGKDLAHPPQVKHDGAGPKDVKFWLNESSETTQASSSKGKKGQKSKISDPSVADAGRYISVYDFFKSRYQITISDKDISLPVVNVGSVSNPSYLPLQVCNVRPGQVARGKISAQQTKEMIKFAVRQPSANAQSITTTGLHLLGLERNDMAAFDIKVEPRLLTVAGRYLSSPMVQYAANAPIPVFNARWNLQSKKLRIATTIRTWKCVVITFIGSKPIWPSPDKLQTCLQSFAKGLAQTGINCAAGPGPIEHFAVNPTNPFPVVSARFAEIAKAKPDFVLVIIPDKTTLIYNAVKYACDVETGLLCQCVIDIKLEKEQLQYQANVALKINLKLGGTNHTVPPNTFGPISPNKTMFVGLDVTHPSPGSAESAPSIAGIVASIDKTLGQWPADIRVQEGRKEMVTDLTELFQGRLKLWQSKNGDRLPENIIVYRDGVSEGQYDVVLTTELPCMKDAIKNVYPPAQKARLSIIIVGKRHHTRFYPAQESQQDKTGNPKDGLVVDRGVTRFAEWDFFLQAHAALHGTAKPAHYYVIYDEVLRALATQGMSAADVLEKMTHGMCYLFGRCTSAVSICPPAYYADLVCERARCYLDELFAPTSGRETPASDVEASLFAARGRVTLHPNIANKMFYI